MYAIVSFIYQSYKLEDVNCIHYYRRYKIRRFIEVIISKDKRQLMGDLPAVRQEKTLRALKTLEINLLLMDFYDGAQLFKDRTTCYFWGGFTSIINLAPTYEELRTLFEDLRPLYPLEHNDEEERRAGVAAFLKWT